MDKPTSVNIIALEGEIDKLTEENTRLLAACKRAAPWLGKLIADGAHLNSVAPNDAIGALEQLEAAITKAESR